jgi:Bacterial protein of unknown function (DUF882)
LFASRRPFLALAVAAFPLLLTAPVAAQSFLDIFKKGEGNPFAPVENGFGTVPHNNTITPTNPDEGNVKKEPEPAEKSAPASTKATAQPKAGSKAAIAKEKAAAEKAKAQKEKSGEDDEDEDALYEYEEPRRVTITLPLPRPGIRIASAADVAPIGTARWNAGKEQLPPGVNFRQTVPLPNPALPGATRVAALPQTQTAPRWSSSDIAPLRPSTLRDVESPVANMPGVYAPPEANFQCLPVGVKQVLVDTAKRFGHVAILNAKRPRGTGARASYHYQCRAVDFRVRGVPVSTVYGFLKAHPNVGGRKIYPFGFFHIDDGPVRSW